MSIEAVSALTAAATASGTAGISTPAAVDPTFGNIVDRMSGLNEQMHVNDQSIRSLALGETNDLHRVMMNLEDTRLQFDLLLQVRNKVLDAYQELMRMQV